MHAVCRITFMLYPIFLYRRMILRNWVLKSLQAYIFLNLYTKKKVREKSRECHNHKPQPFPDPRGRGNRQSQTSTNRTNVRKAPRLALSSPSEVIAILKGLKKKHKNKMTHGKTYNKSPRRINHKATKSKTNTRTTALERSVE